MKITNAVCFFTAILSGPTIAGNFATCVLERMPGSQNDVATYSIFQVCLAKYPGGYRVIAQGDGRSWFGYDSGADCAASKAAGTPNHKAGGAIRVACNCLYDPPNSAQKSCDEQRNGR